jgi:hypothetical protein
MASLTKSRSSPPRLIASTHAQEHCDACSDHLAGSKNLQQYAMTEGIAVRRGVAGSWTTSRALQQYGWTNEARIATYDMIPYFATL